MADITGGLAPIIVNNGNGVNVLSVNQLGTNTIVSVPTGSTTYFYKKLMWLAADFLSNRLGLYSFPEITNNGTAKLTGFTGPRHMLRATRPNCAWNPNGKIRSETTEINVRPLVSQMEQCADAVAECLERIVSAPGKYNDFFNTPEGTALINEFVRMAIEGQFSSISQYAHFANHPLITEMLNNGLYPADSEFTDYVAQQTAHDDQFGVLTQIDTYVAEGQPGYYDDIITTNAAGDFTGDIEVLINTMRRNIPNATFKQIVRYGQSQTTGTRIPVIGRLTDDLFSALEDYVKTIGTGTVENYRYQMKLDDGIINMNNTIYLDGIAWTPDEETAMFDAITGVKTHRAAIYAPGNFAVAFDSQPIRGTNAGMIIQQSNDLKDQGKVYMQSNLRMGMSVRDSQFATAAVKHFVPAA